MIFLVLQAQSEIQIWREKYENKERELVELRITSEVDVEQLKALSKTSQLKAFEAEKELDAIRSQLVVISADEEKMQQLNE